MGSVLMKLHIQVEYGGIGIGTLYGCMIAAYGCTGIMTAIEAIGLGSMPVMIADNQEQKKKKYMARLLEEPLMCTLSLELAVTSINYLKMILKTT